jgi:hypothetical protein
MFDFYREQEQKIAKFSCLSVYLQTNIFFVEHFFLFLFVLYWLWLLWLLLTLFFFLFFKWT